MPRLFSSLGLDFVQIAAGFLLLMAFVFGERSARRFWTNLIHVVFALQCLMIIVFRAGALPKLFAGLMLLATIIIRLVVVRRTHAISKGLSS
jgi:hypothetical protein